MDIHICFHGLDHPAHTTFFFFFKLIYLFVCFYFLAALGLGCCVRAFSSCERGLLFVAVHGLLIVVASLVVEHGL